MTWIMQLDSILSTSELWGLFVHTWADTFHGQIRQYITRDTEKYHNVSLPIDINKYSYIQLFLIKTFNGCYVTLIYIMSNRNYK